MIYAKGRITLVKEVTTIWMWFFQHPTFWKLIWKSWLLLSQRGHHLLMVGFDSYFLESFVTYVF